VLDIEMFDKMNGDNSNAPYC